jgi:hypothetical protein
MSDPSPELLAWLDRIQNQGLVVVLPDLLNGAGPEVCDRLLELMRHSYWKDKAVDLALRLGEVGVIYAHTAAAGEPDAEGAKQLLYKAKGFAYDIGSFAWVGWDEPGIEIDSKAVELGAEAAALNLALADQLVRGDLPMSRAHWLVAGYQLTGGQFSSAATSFDQGAAFAAKAGAEADRLLNMAFAGLARWLEISSEAAKSKYQAALKALAQTEHGDSFVAQVSAAQAVCERLGLNR